MKTIFATLAVAASFAAIAPAAHAEDHSCRAIGGTALGQIYDENQIIAAMDGTWASARGEILSQTDTETGFRAEMQHVFATDDGGIVKTRDNAEFTAVPGKDNTYMLELAYTVVEGFGTLEGYSGTFNSFGLIKMNDGTALVRYEGEVCN